MSQQVDAYRILQVLPTADQEEIKVAYRRLARRYHPDRAPDDVSTSRMIELNQAWELVGDPSRRAAYDRANGFSADPRRAASAAAHTATGYSPSESSGPPHHDAAPHAGPPPGRPSGSVLTFGRYSGWSLGEIARVDREYIEWLDRMPIGRQYRHEIRELLRARAGMTQPAEPERTRRRSLFR